MSEDEGEFLCEVECDYVNGKDTAGLEEDSLTGWRHSQQIIALGSWRGL